MAQIFLEDGVANRDLRPPIRFFLFVVLVAIIALCIRAPRKDTRVMVMLNYYKNKMRYTFFEISAPEVDVQLRNDGLKYTTIETRGIRNAANHRYDSITIWAPTPEYVRFWQEWFQNERAYRDGKRQYLELQPAVPTFELP